jgi:multiple sugar transport system permease protein
VTESVRPGLSRARIRRGLNGALALLPFTLFVAGLSVYPIAQVVRMSLSDIRLTAAGFQFSWGGLANYGAVLTDRYAWQAIDNTVVFVVVTVLSSVVVGVGLALLVNRAVVLLPIARNVMIWPAVIAPVVVSLVWLLLLSPTVGGVNRVLASFGLPGQLWLNSGPTAMLSLMVVDLWHWTPVVFLFIYTALQSISGDILEAARIDGANERQVIRRIVLPLLVPAITAVALVRTVMGIKVFDEMYLMTSGGPAGATTLVSQRVQLWFFQDLNYGEASAFSIVVVILTAVVLGVVMLLRSIARRRAS